MIIGPAAPLGGLNPIESHLNLNPIGAREALQPIPDSVHLTEAARLASEALSIDAIRTDRVLELKLQIADGSFETSERLESAVAKLLIQFE